jgi:hypothetical protein
MKTGRYLLFLFFILLQRAEAQEEPEGPKLCCLRDYKMRVEVPMYKCNIRGHVSDSVVVVAEPGALFTIVNITETDSLIIRFWEWKENALLNARLCYEDSLSNVRQYFLVSRRDVSTRVVERFSRNPGFTAGTVLVPFKLRLQKFDFSNDITLGPTAGVRFRLSHYMPHYVSVVSGIGITSVTVDAYELDGIVTEAMEVPALTPFLGFVFELNHVLQAGMFCGWDHVANNESLHFRYHGKTWISFGLGYSLISFNEEKSFPED